MKLIIHLGMAKSASTFLQNIAINNKSILESNSLDYIHEFRNVSVDHEELKIFFSREIKKRDQNINMLFSNENFLNPSEPDSGGVYKGAKKSIETLKNSLLEFIPIADFQFIFISRNILEFYISQYVQLKKQGANIDIDRHLSKLNSVSFFLKNIDDALDSLRLIGKVNVIDFSTIKEDAHFFVNSFFNICGLKDVNLKYSTEIVNPSIDENGMKILDICKCSLKKREYISMRKMVQAYFPKKEPYDWEISLYERYGTIASKEYQAFKNKWIV